MLCCRVTFRSILKCFTALVAGASTLQFVFSGKQADVATGASSTVRTRDNVRSDDRSTDRHTPFLHCALADSIAGPQIIVKQTNTTKQARKKVFMVPFQLSDDS